VIDSANLRETLQILGIVAIVLVVVGIIGVAVFLFVLRKKRLEGDEGWPHCGRRMARCIGKEEKEEDEEVVHELLSGQDLEDDLTSEEK